MTDDPPADPDSTAARQPTGGNGQCEQVDSPKQREDPPRHPASNGSQGELIKMDQEMRITESIEDGGKVDTGRYTPSCVKAIMRQMPRKSLDTFRQRASWERNAPFCARKNNWLTSWILGIFKYTFHFTGRDKIRFKKMIVG